MRSILLSFLLLIAITGQTSAQLIKDTPARHNWEPGCFYDNAGNKTCGQLAEFISRPRSVYNTGDKYFVFRATDNDSAKSIYIKNIKSLTAGKDSFVVSNSKPLQAATILQVVINGPVKLYAARTVYKVIGLFSTAGTKSKTSTQTPEALPDSSFNATNNTFYYGESPENLTLLTKKNFNTGMSAIMADRPDIVTGIKNNEFSLRTIDDLFNLYIYSKRTQKQ